MKAFACFIALALTGCSVPQESATEAQRNTCSTDKDCGASGVCSAVGDTKICTATEVGLAGLQIVVTPPGGIATVSGASTTFDAKAQLNLQKSVKSGFTERLALKLPAPQTLSFETTYPCADENPVEVPATIVFTGSGELNGLSPTNVLTSPDPNSITREVAALTPGLYQGWVTPGKSVACKTAAPPTIFDFCFLDAKDCPDGTTPIATTNRLNLPTSFVLGGSITSSFSLDKWTLDIVDSLGVRLISDSQKLKQPEGVATQLTFTNLRFNWPKRIVDPLIRLTPPKGSSAPTIYWDLATTLGPSSNYDVKLTVGTFQNHKVKTQVIVLDGASQPQAGVIVSFTATSIDGLDCIYTLAPSVETDRNGVANVELPPGRYEVVATPPSNSDLTVTQKGLTINDTGAPSAGHGIQLGKRVKYDGHLETATGDPLVGIQMTSAPAIAKTTFVFGANQVTTTVPGNTSTATTDEDGAFSLRLDVNALLNVSAQPDPESGFPWVVVPQVLLTSATSAPPPKTLKASWPAVISGVVTDSNGTPIANATVGAFLPVAGGGIKAAVQIGTTTSDANGNYVLILPASISQDE